MYDVIQAACKLVAITIVVAGCGADDAPTDAAVIADAGTMDAVLDDALLDGAVDASNPMDGAADGAIRFDAAGCAVTDAACGEPFAFTPMTPCTDAVRACLATCTTTTPGCYHACARLGPRDCDLCFAARYLDCMVDWCGAENTAFDCCDLNVCHFGRCCSCDAELASLTSCRNRVWATSCKDTYYEQCFAPP